MIGRRFRAPAAEVDKPKGFDDFELRLGDMMRGERATLGKSLLDIQRDLKIKATYIAAIENADVSAFETPGFIAGYVRSYSRYLGMDPDAAFAKFCREANFEVAHGMSAAASSASLTAMRARQASGDRDVFADVNPSFVPRSEGVFSRIEPGAVGSIAVLIALIGALGYGGWSVLQEVQRVRLSPVDQAPVVVAEIDPLANAAIVPVEPTTPAQQLVNADGSPAADPLDRLYRPEALTAPVLTARDGPISAINPRLAGTLDVAQADDASGIVAAAEAAVQVVADAKPGVAVLAVRPSWVRVSAADGTVLFEKILDAGERYDVPPLQEAALLRSGNSGSIYFVVDGKTYGPAAPGAQVIKNVALSSEALTQNYAAADISGDSDLAQFVNVADASDAGAALVPAPTE